MADDELEAASGGTRAAGGMCCALRPDMCTVWLTLLVSRDGSTLLVTDY
jgi:hypothetical protein